MNTDYLYMQRAIQLAHLANAAVSPNPLVGALLVHQGRIIGEGWHQQYGQAHAEVQAVQNVMPKDKSLIAKSTLYCTLEPCCVQGRTPACTDWIIQHHIPKVVVGGIDQTAAVKGKGLARLRNAGVEVQLLENKYHWKMPHRFRNVFVTQRRPYIILKWAQSRDGYIGKAGQSIGLSNAFTKRWVHKWRSEVAAIMVGTQTALCDNPQLTNRHYFGSHPLRIVPDRQARLPDDLHLFSTFDTWVLGREASDCWSANIQAFPHIQELPALFDALYRHGHNTLLVEGGAQLLKHFIDANWWDEARIIHTPVMLKNGIAAPALSGQLHHTQMVDQDRCDFLFRKDTY